MAITNDILRGASNVLSFFKTILTLGIPSVIWNIGVFFLCFSLVWYILRQFKE